MRVRLVAALAIAVALAGSAGAAECAHRVKVRTDRMLDPAGVETLLPGVKNAACLLPGTLTGGQIDSAGVRGLKRAGVRLVLDLRTAGESRGFDEPGVVRGAGIRYVSVPIGHDSIPDSTFDAVRALMKDTRKPVLVHCASGNRVGAALIPVMVLDRGLSPDSALAVAKRVGLKGEGLRESALRYVERQRSTAPPR